MAQGQRGRHRDPLLLLGPGAAQRAGAATGSPQPRGAAHQRQGNHFSDLEL